MRIKSAIFLGLATVASSSFGSVEFSRDGQSVLVPFQKQLDLTGETTLEAWIYPEDASKNRFFNYIVSRNYGGLGYGLSLQGHETKTTNLGGPKIPLGQWTHLAISHGSHALKLYINGELAIVLPGDQRPHAAPLPLYIGNSNFTADPGNQPTGFFGKIAEVRIWDVALDQSQIRSTMNRYVRSDHPHLAAYFPLIEGKGVLVHDYSGHLISGHMGDSYTPDSNDPQWSEDQPPMKGRKPRLRKRVSGNV